MGHNNTAPPPEAVPTPAPRTTTEPMLDIFDGPAPTHSTPHSAPHSSSGSNLLDVPAAAPVHSSLLDMHAPTTDYGNTASTSSASDFLGMTAPPPATPSQHQPAQAQPYGVATPRYPQHPMHHGQQQQ